MSTFRLLAAAAALSFGCSSGPGSVAEPLKPGQDPGSLEKPAPSGEKQKPAAHEPPELRLSDAATPLTYIVNLELDPRADSFTGDARINVELANATDHLWLHGTDLEVTGAQLKTADQILELTILEDESEHFLGFGFPQQVGPGQVWLEIQYRGKVSEKDYSGLFRQQDDGNWYLYSQLEAYSARRVFPSFDEPRWKVPFTVSLTVPEGMEALSNTPAKQVTKTDGGKKTVVFETTKPLPTYLFAVAVGPFEAVDIGKVGRNKTPVRIVVPKGKTDRVGFAKQSVVALQEKLEDYFDLGYPYRKLDHIVVPHFLGAMENPGLITYDSGILLAPVNEETRGFKATNANVVGHELAHQWFGNLVTLAWWDDIWLNESFATWLAAKVVDEWKPEWKGEISAVAQRGGVMSSDSMVTARKIRQPIASHADIAGAFDGITYGKGSAVLWMFERAIGPERFKKGVRHYIRKHSWKTATAADFLAAIAAVSDEQTPAAFRTFLDQPGVPVVSVGLSCEKGASPALSLSQKRYLPEGSQGSSQQTWHIPVCVKYDAGKKVDTTCTILREQQASVKLAEAKRCPRWVLANAGAAGYYRTAYDGKLLDQLIRKGGKQLTVTERINVISDLNALVAANEVGIGDALAQLPALLADSNPYVMRNATGIVAQLNDFVVPEKLEPNLARFIRKTFGKQARKLGWTATKGEDEQTARLRSTLVPLVAIRGQDEKLRAQATSLAKKWLETGKGVGREQIGEVLTAVAYDGDAALREQILAKAMAADDKGLRRELLTVVAQFRDPKLIQKNLDLFLGNDKLDMREAFVLLGGGLAHRETRQMVYDFIKKNHVAIMDKLPRMARGYIVYMAQAFCDQEHYDDAKAFFTPIAKKELQGEKLLAQTLERMQLCMAFRKAQGPKVETFLKRY